MFIYHKDRRSRHSCRHSLLRRHTAIARECNDRHLGSGIQPNYSSHFLKGNISRIKAYHMGRLLLVKQYRYKKARAASIGQINKKLCISLVQRKTQ